MSKVQLSGNANGTGIFTIASPNSNTDRTLTLPDNTGTIITTASTGGVSQAMLATGVVGTGPAFLAYRTSALSLSAGVATKYTFTNTLFDTSSSVDTANGKFQPNVAGYYFLSITTLMASTSATQSHNYYKNGGNFVQPANTSPSTLSWINSTAFVYLNGTTDYMEFYITSGNTQNLYFDAIPSKGSHVYGYLARAA